MSPLATLVVEDWIETAKKANKRLLKKNYFIKKARKENKRKRK